MFNQKTIAPFLYLLPTMMILSVFIYYPLIKNIEYSFFEIDTLTNIKEFIGFENYKSLFKDQVFLIALKNNALYTIISIVVQVGGGLIVAALLQDKLIRKISPLFRTVFFIPVLISTTIISLLFNFLYSREVMFNQLLATLVFAIFASG